MAKQKKTLITFLMLVATILSILNTLLQTSDLLKIPLPVLIILILLVYVFWKEG
jgi:predicted membrane protein